MTDLRILRLVSILFLIGIFAALAWADPVSARQLQHVQGTSVSLEPMRGFQPTSSFAGFMNPNQGSILIAEMPEAAYAQFAQGLGNIETAKSNFAKRNVIIDGLQEITTAEGGKAPLVTGSQTNGGTIYDKWIAVFKGPPTVLITVTSPRANKLDSAQVRAMMESVVVGQKATLADKLAALPFSATPAPPFRILDSLAGAALGMTVGDKDVDPERTQPQVIIAYEPALVDDPAELERNPTPPHSLGNPQIESRKNVKFAGISGMLLNGRCDGGRRFLEYLAVTKDRKLIAMVFVAPEPSFDGLKEAVEAIASSVVVKPN
ncbi:hypothetical protein SAMN05444159_5284 [Bradyrhizobium lablabi]|uniref:Uncharacterized protein n=1 Tax=Bradyrhizobium lablabi TaxID=722472 RepID=A0A1M6YPC6_9BRAD|nr:hypothetical protein [Bradyrhizobium lablabi]SHL19922.1 hypothetical protein SAMN05444159_5284 [Bradyrhizobium lablabi]